MSDSFVTPWTIAHQAPLFVGFSKQGCWGGLPFPSPGDLPDPGIESVFSCLSPSPGKPHFGISLPVPLKITKRLTLGTLIYYREAIINFSFPCVSDGKESACNADSIPGSGRSPGEGNGNSLPYSCLGNPMDRGCWLAIVHGVTKVRHDLATKQSSFY